MSVSVISNSGVQFTEDSSIAIMMDKMNDQVSKMFNDCIFNTIQECSLLYNFDASEAMRRLSVNINIPGKKINKEKKVKDIVKKIPIPFNGMKNYDNCCALMINHGLYTQCDNKKMNDTDESYCVSCDNMIKKGVLPVGTIDDRVSCGIMEYKDSKGRKPTHYLKVLKKLDISVEEVDMLNVLDIHLKETAVMKGRPAKVKEVKVVREKGRPKKDKKEIEIEDLFASLMLDDKVTLETSTPEKMIAEVNNTNDDISVLSCTSNGTKILSVSNEKVETDQIQKAEKEATAAALKAEKEATATALKAAKAEKEAAAAALKAEKEAAAAALKAEKEAAAAALKAEKEAAAVALKAEKEAAIAKAKTEKEATATALKAEKEAAIAKAKAEKEAAAAALKAEKEATAAALKAEKEAAIAKAKAEKEAVNDKKKAIVDIPAVTTEEADIVKKITYEGVTYLKSKKTNVIYNMEQEVVGKWNESTSKIDFEEADDCEEEEEEEYDE